MLKSICTLLLLAFSWSANAQIHQAGQTALEFSTGLLDGFKLPGQDNFGYFAGLTYSKYRSHYSYWKLGAHQNQKFYAYDRKFVPLTQWLGEATYFTRVMGLVGRGWLLNVGGGLAGGYESINQDRYSIEGATLLNRSNWVVGPTVGLELEYLFSSQVMLIGRVQEYYLFRSSVIPTRFNVGVGLKFILPTDSDN